MNKALTSLEAYERLCSHLDYDSDDYMFNGSYEEDNEIIEKALTDYEELQKVLDDFGIYNTMNLIDTLKNIQFLEKQNTINSKKLIALEIIKEKKVDIKDLINEFDWSDGLTSYNERTNHIPLTKEEYDLLKEELE